MIEYRRCKLISDPRELNGLLDWLAAERLEGLASSAERLLDWARSIDVPAPREVYEVEELLCLIVQHGHCNLRISRDSLPTRKVMLDV